MFLTKQFDIIQLSRTYLSFFFFFISTICLTSRQFNWPAKNQVISEDAYLLVFALWCEFDKWNFCLRLLMPVPVNEPCTLLTVWFIAFYLLQCVKMAKVNFFIFTADVSDERYNFKNKKTVKVTNGDQKISRKKTERKHSEKNDESLHRKLK